MSNDNLIPDKDKRIPPKVYLLINDTTFAEVIGVYVRPKNAFKEMAFLKGLKENKKAHFKIQEIYVTDYRGENDNSQHGEM